MVAIFCEQMLQNVTPKIFGNGTKTRDYIYVSDVARANVQALYHGDQEIFNIAFGRPTTDNEIFDAVRTALGIAPFKPHYVDKRPGEIDHCYLDISKATERLNWKPKVPVAEGVQLTATYFKQRFVRAAEA